MEFVFIYVLGAWLYCLIEILYRGFTHWSMFFVGGGCFLMMYALSQTVLPLWAKWLSSAAVITAVELLSGIVLNIVLGLGVWDYSSRKLNLLGQICPLFSLYWLALSVFGIALCSFLRPLLQRLLRA